MERKYEFPGQTKFEQGKVRDLYFIGNKEAIICFSSDRISAFDVELPPKIPYKGAVLNLITASMMKQTEDIVPNCIINIPHPKVCIWKMATPFKVEMVIRGYLVGHAWREYKEGKRTLCGVPLPEGMKENEKFPFPIITPTNKAKKGEHDEDISKEEIISSGLVSKEDYEQLEKYTYALFQRGTEIAEKNGLILVDTKYEFGKDKNGTIILIDEVHTPDSSRYWYFDTYEEYLKNGKEPKSLSKEFVRKWLMEQGFQGREGDVMPEFSKKLNKSITSRYIELYLTIIPIEEYALPTEEDLQIDPYDSICRVLASLPEVVNV